MRSIRERSYYSVADQLYELFDPHLRGLSPEDIADRLRNKTNLIFYNYKRKATPVWMRFTLPVAIVVMAVLFLFSPINYMITGRWGYRFGDRMLNWITALGL